MAEPVEPVEIDGSRGEGGGQILRTSLALSVITGRPLRLFNVRARRRKPGLQRQHLACVRAAAAICRAEVSGDSIGSGVVVFRPRALAGGEYRFDIGSAGSTGLVVQTVLPALLAAPSPSRILVEGGTHNPLSPPFDFLARAFVPELRRMGAHVDLRLERHGFAPAGGGCVVCEIEPARLQPVELLAAGPVARRHARAILSRLPTHVGDRELGVVRERLGWSADECEIVDVRSPGPGNALLLEIERPLTEGSDRGGVVRELVVGFGEKGTRAEKVAEDACRELEALLASGLPVGMHLADQLLLPMALAGGGRFRTVAPSLHTTTNAEVIRRFLDVSIAIEPIAAGAEISLS